MGYHKGSAPRSPWGVTLQLSRPHVLVGHWHSLLMPETLPAPPPSLSSSVPSLSPERSSVLSRSPPVSEKPSLSEVTHRGNAHRCSRGSYSQSRASRSHHLNPKGQGLGGAGGKAAHGCPQDRQWEDPQDHGTSLPGK